MCEINAIVKIGDCHLSDQDESEFLKMLEAGGKRNSDAWGYFTPTFTNKFSGNHISQNLKINHADDWFIVGHNRLSTGGDPKDNKNNHPFCSNNYIMMHNGRITNTDKLIKKYNLETENINTDSYVILKLIEQFHSSNFKNTLNNVLPLIEGTYSILIYDKKYDQLYYFKDHNTSFNIGISGKNTIVMSTSKRRIKNFNKKNIWNFNRTKAKKIPYLKNGLIDYHLYKINKNGIMDLGELLHNRKIYNYICRNIYNHDDPKYPDELDLCDFEIIGKEFDLDEMDISVLIDDMQINVECPLYNECEIDPEFCPFCYEAINNDIPDYCQKLLDLE